MAAKLKKNLMNFNENSQFHSPYITGGYYAQNITYDPIFSLSNFLNVLENGRRKTLGEGSLATVFLVKNKTNGQYYAVKYMRKSLLKQTTHGMRGVYREKNYQSRMFHPNIVRLLNVEETQDSYYFVMEYGENGSLFNFIHAKEGLTEDEAFIFFIQVANALYFLHNNGFIHRDLKPENILLFRDNVVKLCDFGWCCNLNSQGGERQTYCGTTEYMSPEIINKKKYRKEIDIWSLGVLLYEMIHAYSPFSLNVQKQGEKGIIENIKKHKLEFHKPISDECRELITTLLEQDPRKRIKIKDVFNSKFVKKYERLGVGFPNKKVEIPLNVIDEGRQNIVGEKEQEEKLNIKVPDKNYSYFAPANSKEELKENLYATGICKCWAS